MPDPIRETTANGGGIASRLGRYLQRRWRGYVGCGLLYLAWSRVTGDDWYGFASIVIFVFGIELLLEQRIKDAANAR